MSKNDVPNSKKQEDIVCPFFTHVCLIPALVNESDLASSINLDEILQDKNVVKKIVGFRFIVYKGQAFFMKQANLTNSIP